MSASASVIPTAKAVVSNLPSTREVTTAIHNAVNSASAPLALVHAHRWFWVLVILCVVASVLAFFTTHFLAGIKFALAAIVGAACNYLFGVLIGSFVLSCFASFGAGLIVAWYILNGRHQFEPNKIVLSLNNRLGEAESKLHDALNKQVNEAQNK